MSFLHFLFDSLITLIFPKECIGCGRLNTVLCETCLARIEITFGFLCPGCFNISTEGVIHEACREKSRLDGLVTAVSWEQQIVKDAIHSLKYEGVKDLAAPLAQMLYKKIQVSSLFFQFLTSQADAVIPVPLHRKKVFERMYNQSELLAWELSRFVPMKARADILLKSKRSKSQTKLKGKERFENVYRTFEINPNLDLAGANIVLLDDVVTSGATMNELARVLKQNGANFVWGLAVTRG